MTHGEMKIGSQPLGRRSRARKRVFGPNCAARRKRDVDLRTAALAPLLRESCVHSVRRRNPFPLHAIQRKTPTTIVTGASVNQWVRGFPLSPFEAPRSQWLSGKFLSGQKPQPRESK